MLANTGESGPHGEYAHEARLGTFANTNPGLEVAVDESQQSRISAAAFEPGHEAVVIDPVKERLQVHVYHPCVAFTDARLHMAHRLMG